MKHYTEADLEAARTRHDDAVRHVEALRQSLAEAEKAADRALHTWRTIKAELDDVELRNCRILRYDRLISTRPESFQALWIPAAADSEATVRLSAARRQAKLHGGSTIKGETPGGVVLLFPAG